MSVVPFHPLADLFPLIEGKEFDELVEDIRENGLRERIVIHEGQILDGRNRYRAALAAGVLDDEEARVASGWVKPLIAPMTAEYTRSQFQRFDPRSGDALKWVLSKNLHRRHLSESQRAMVAARIAKMPVGRPPDYERGHDKPANLPDLSPVKQADAADTLHVSERSVRTARKVQDSAAPEVVEAVDRGELSVSAAAEIAALPVSEQLEIMRQADPKAVARLVKEHREKKVAAKKQARETRECDLAAKQQALPDKRYGVIYADPEWRFEPYNRESGMDRAADNHYPTSELDAIKARPVGEIAAEDCVLFLWATVPMLPQALEVMAAWGFAYKSHFVWHKQRHLGTGYWNRNCHELLLLGTRGNPPAPAMGGQWPSILSDKPGPHSAKPVCMLEMIEEYFPNLPRIELNRRGIPRHGWSAWGNEVAADPSNEIQVGEDGIADASHLPHPTATVRSEADGTHPSPGADASCRSTTGLSAFSPPDVPPAPPALRDGSKSPKGEVKAPMTRAEQLAIIEACYRARPAVPAAEVAAATGLGIDNVRKIASKNGWASRDNQRQAARKTVSAARAARK